MSGPLPPATRPSAARRALADALMGVSTEAWSIAIALKHEDPDELRLASVRTRALAEHMCRLVRAMG